MFSRLSDHKDIFDIIIKNDEKNIHGFCLECHFVDESDNIKCPDDLDTHYCLHKEDGDLSLRECSNIKNQQWIYNYSIWFKCRKTFSIEFPRIKIINFRRVPYHWRKLVIYILSPRNALSN